MTKRRASELRTAVRGAVLILATMVLVALDFGMVAAQAATPPPVPVIVDVTPAIVSPGDTIKIKGRSFAEVRAVSMAGLALKHTVRSRKLITAKAPPNAARGTIVVSARGGTATSPRFIVVKPKLRVTPQRNPAGERLTVRGSGFMPGEPVDLYFGRTAVVGTAADRRGALEPTDLIIPLKAVPGGEIIRAQGRFSGVPVDVPIEVGADWPQRGLTADGSRHNRFERTIGVTAMPALSLDWVADLIGPSRSTPTVVGDSVYVGADTGALIQLPTDCASGGAGCDAKALGVARGAISSAPAVVDGMAYVGSEAGFVYAFETACPVEERPCPPAWSAEVGGPIDSSPAVAEGVVVIGSGDGNVYAFDAACEESPCQPLWVGRTRGPIESSPAIHDGVVYVGSWDGYLHAFDAACASDGRTCEPLWRGGTGGGVRSSPTVANGVVYVGSADSTVRGFPVGCTSGGEVCEAIWRGNADAAVESSPVVADGYVVVGTMAGSVMGFPVACPDQEAGCGPTWIADTGGPVRSSAAIGGVAPGGSTVFIGSDDGFVYGYPLKCRPSGKPARCQPLWASGTRAAISAAPTLVNGALYASSEDGTVRAWSLP